MARINAMNKTAETATQASEVFKAVAHNITRNGKPVDNAFAAVRTAQTLWSRFLPAPPAGVGTNDMRFGQQGDRNR